MSVSREPSIDAEAVKACVDLVEVAGRYTSLKRQGRQLIGLCPLHQEKTPSFTVDPKKGAWYCHGCGQGGDVIALVRAAQKLDFVDAVKALSGDARAQPPPRNGHGDRATKPTGPVPGLTLAELVEAKGLPIGHLRSLGWTDGSWHGTPAVLIPWRTALDRTVIHYRVGLTGGDRFRWQKGAKAGELLYGVEQIAKARKEGWVLVVEGETDCAAGWLHDLPVVGVAGQGNFGEAQARLLKGIPEVYVWSEPGAKLAERVLLELPDARVIDAPPGIKDVGEAHWLMGDRLPLWLNRLRAEAMGPRVEPGRQEDDTDPSPMVTPQFPLWVLPKAAQEYVQRQERRGLPMDFLGCSALAAMAAAIGGGATLRVNETWQTRAILWFGLVGKNGTGKSPSISAMLRPLRDVQAELMAEYKDELDRWKALPRKEREHEPKPIPRRLLIGDTTIEALARQMDHEPAAALVADELRGFIAGLGQYKRGGGSDHDRALEIWTGEPWPYQRVADDLTLYIARPTLVVLGGIQPARLGVLGAGEDGLRARWLLARVDAPAPEDDLLFDDGGSGLDAWADLLRRLWCVRSQERDWTFSPEARDRFLRERKRLRAIGFDPEQPDQVAELARKGDLYLLRLALTLAEGLRAESAGARPEVLSATGEITLDVTSRGTALTDYFLDERRVIDFPRENLLASLRDRDKDRGVAELLERLASKPDGRMTPRDVQRAHVGGLRTMTEATDLMLRYGQTYAGCHVTEKTTRGETPVVYHPSQRSGASRNDAPQTNVANVANVATGNVDNAERRVGDDPPTPKDEAADDPSPSSDNDVLKVPAGDIGDIGDITRRPDAQRQKGPPRAKPGSTPHVVDGGPDRPKKPRRPTQRQREHERIEAETADELEAQRAAAERAYGHLGGYWKPGFWITADGHPIRLTPEGMARAEEEAREQEQRLADLDRVAAEVRAEAPRNGHRPGRRVAQLPSGWYVLDGDGNQVSGPYASQEEAERHR